MTKLSVEERDLLRRIDSKRELRPIFLQKVQGLQWFNELDELRFFAAQDNPRPQKTTDDGHVLVPYWDVLDYLEKTSLELNDQENAEYSQKFRDILILVTQFAKENKFSNYRTWGQFSLIISKIPSKFLSVNDLEIVDYWLDDPYDNYLVCEFLGIRWLPLLLAQSDQHSHELAIKLVSLIFRVKLSSEFSSLIDPRSVEIRVEFYLGRKIINRISERLGCELGIQVLPIFESQIKSILDHLKSDRSSVIWHPAVEEHEQNAIRDKPIDLLIDIFRNTLNAFIATNSDDAIEYVSKILKCEYTTLKRVAIHAIDENFRICREFFNQLLEPSFWTEHYRHELWTLLNHNYSSLSEEQKKSVLSRIQSIDADDDTHSAQTRAYQRAEWLAAIEDHGDNEKELYLQCTKEAEAEPEHPSFAAYMQSGWVEPKFPISVDQLSAMDTPDLIEYLETFEDDNANFLESPIKGLYEAFRQVIKSSPLSFSQRLASFDNIDLSYVFQITEAFREIWVGKTSLPWTDIWKPLLHFCQRLVSNDEFWNEGNAKYRGATIPNRHQVDRHQVVGSIATLIEAGVKVDDHAFDPTLLDNAEEIVVIMLRNQVGEAFDNNNDAVDAVFHAINSPRGKCINALVNLTLRKCRIADVTNDKDHAAVWKHFEHWYNQELEFRSPPSYEVATLFANYLPNFLYMSAEWTMESLDTLFSAQDQKWWRCAMEGYAYAKTSEKIYLYLKENGHLIKVLDDDTIHHLAKDRAIENICIAYCREIESLEADDSLISVLISRNDSDELKKAIVNLWRIGTNNIEFAPKIIAFWQEVLTKLDLESQEGRAVASQLCMLAEFIKEVDDSTLELIRAVAPYVGRNDYRMFEWLEKISDSQPLEASQIWKSMLLRTPLPAYPETSIKNILKNILKEGHEGKVRAQEITDTYIKEDGNDAPRKWLYEILDNQ